MYQRIQFANRSHHKLSAYLHTPRQDTPRIIVITHSFKGHKDYQPIMGDFSLAAEECGYAVLRYDSWGSGDSEGVFSVSTIRSQTEDLIDAVNYSRKLGYSSIIQIGFSLGSTVSLKAAAQTDPSCNVLWSPTFDHLLGYEQHKKAMLRKGFSKSKRTLAGDWVIIGKAMWEEFKKEDCAAYLPHLKCPICTIMGSQDTLTSIEKAQRYMALCLADHQVCAIENGDHNWLLDSAKNKAIQLTLEWINQYA